MSVLSKAAKPLVRLVDRYLPDPYVFVLLLSLIAIVAAMAIEGLGPLAVIEMWGDGFWGLLGFSMQMLLVLVTGFMLASTPPVKRVLVAIARSVKSPGMAIITVSLVSLAAHWINWGFGLIVSALLAREIARVVHVDYRLLIASAYSGFVIWHGGLSGSIPLSIATPGHPFEALTGVIPTGETTFAFFNLAIVAALVVLVPLVNRLMLPAEADSVFVDRALLKEPPPIDDKFTRPAERLETCRAASLLVGAAGVVWLVSHFARGGGLTLNAVNFVFLTLAILLHGTPRRLLASLQEAIKGGGGIVIQFPFYAGIMGIMVESGLADTLSKALLTFATAETLPFLAFLSGGIVNFFVPSGGGQWAVQAPAILPAAAALDVDMARIAMAVAWGDAWTSLVQPFWVLPVLAIAGLQAKDVMGFCVMQLVLTGIVISIGLTWL
jgi:short-chain fatty acids transporter